MISVNGSAIWKTASVSALLLVNTSTVGIARENTTLSHSNTSFASTRARAATMQLWRKVPLLRSKNLRLAIQLAAPGVQTCGTTYQNGQGPNSFVGIAAGLDFAGGLNEGNAPTQYAGVPAGYGNAACSTNAAVLAGQDNQAGSGDFETDQTYDGIIGGGSGNLLHNASGSFIGAGFTNTIFGQANEVNVNIAAGSGVVSGSGNSIIDEQTSLVGSGTNNVITAAACAVTPQCNAISSFIGSGDGNTIGSGAASGGDSSILGGVRNSIIGTASVIGGGQLNVSQARQDFIGGGYQNQITVNANGGANGGALATIGGGSYNSIRASTPSAGYFSVISGGTQNTVTGIAAAIPGGTSNNAAGYDSFAAGTGSYAKHDGSFVFSDYSSNAKQLVTVGNNEFLARASGGVAFYTSPDLKSGVMLRAGAGSWSSLSDRASKTNIVALDPSMVLAKVVKLPVSEWSYRSEDGAIRHVGPMAQDFYATFGVGEDERHITTIDEDGVALAAIKGLAAEGRRKDDRVARLEQKVRELAASEAELRSEVSALVTRK